jgi:cation diffusion facilitator family transporter
MDAISRQRGVGRVLWFVLALNVVITAIKLVIGLLTGSISVIADAFHSLLDSSSNVIGLIGLAIASKPPDPDHPYGHRKYETMATLAIGTLLLLVCWEIISAIYERLTGGGAPNVTPEAFVIMLGTLPVNFAITLYESRAARRLNSELLMADAMHTRTDLLVTFSVLVSLAGTWLGFPWLDLVVASGVVVLIAFVALGILRRTSDVLADSAVIDPARVEAVARQAPGVWFVHHIRSRGRADEAYVDLHVKVDPAMSTAQAHAIATEVEHRLKNELGVVDAVVHIEPGQQQPPDPWEATMVHVRAIGDGLGIGVHEIHGHQGPNGYALQLHAEVDGNLSLAEAHALVTQLEERVRTEVRDVASVETHIEPRSAHILPSADGRTGWSALQERIRTIADGVYGPGACHEVVLHPSDGHFDATLHCTWRPDAPLVEAHALAEEVERRLLTDLPALSRVVVHVEPPGS